MANSHRKPRRSPSALVRRLPRYATTAAVAVTLPALPAAIVHDTTPFNVNTPNSHHFWDIDGGGVNDFRFSNYVSGGNKSITAAHQLASNAWVKNPGSTNLNLRALPANFTIGAAAVFQSHSRVLFTYDSAAQGGLHSGTEFVGFRFLITGQEHYGWANITIGANSLTVHDWAYESTANTPILAGQTVVPEPAQAATGLGLLALGAVGVSAYRRRRQKAA